MAKGDPASEEAQQRIEDALEAALEAASLAALAVIAEAVRKAGSGQPLVKVLASQQEAMARLDKALESGAAAAEAVTAEAFDALADGSQEWAQPYYEARGMEQRPWRESATMSGIVEAGKKASKDIAAKTVRTSVVGIVNRRGEFRPAAQAYREAVAEAAGAMARGQAEFARVAARTAQTLARSGLRVLYASGHTRELYAAVATNVMDTYRTTLSSMRTAQGVEFGADGVEVSAHALCAPDHQPYQGGQFTRREFDDIQRGLSRPIMTGANCRHTTWPIIKGVSAGAYSEEERRAITERSNELVSFTGAGGKELTMTRYEASQYQRGMERSIRQLKAEKYLGGDVSDAAIRQRAAAYRQMSKQAGLNTRIERTRAYVPS